jgi:hypothetical protein
MLGIAVEYEAEGDIRHQFYQTTEQKEKTFIAENVWHPKKILSPNR